MEAKKIVNVSPKNQEILSLMDLHTGQSRSSGSGFKISTSGDFHNIYISPKI
jgi:hypothetical protein